MFSVLNVNFGRELLPQGVTILTLENRGYEVCGEIFIQELIEGILGLLAKQYVPGQSGDKYECMLDWDRMFQV